LAARSDPVRIWMAAAVYRRTRPHYPRRSGGVNRTWYVTMDGGNRLC